jgi:hypothetical protein
METGTTLRQNSVQVEQRKVDSTSSPQVETGTMKQREQTEVSSQKSEDTLNGCGCAARIVERQTSNVTDTSGVTRFSTPCGRQSRTPGDPAKRSASNGETHSGYKSYFWVLKTGQNTLISN